MKKRLFALCASLFIAVMSVTVSASEGFYRLQDTAGLLSEAENAQIQALLDEVSEKHGMDITILTVDAVEEGLTVEQDATEWYEYLEFDPDGVMLYISMEKRDRYLLTSGYGITAITDAGIEYISDKFVSCLSEGDYVGAFSTYIRYVDEFIVQAKTGKPYDVGNMPEEPKEPYSLGLCLVISLGIGFLVSLIINTVWKSSLKSVALKTRASEYLKPGSLNITEARDFFLYRKVDCVEKRDNDSGGSTTHKSSSGRTYGGGGGKF